MRPHRKRGLMAMADDDAVRIEKLEGEIARLRQLVAEYAAEATQLRQNDQARVRQNIAIKAVRLTSEETDYALSMGGKPPRLPRRKSA